MKRGTILGLSITLLLLASMLPVRAGGWATVRFDEELGDVVAGQPYTIGLSVWAHDRAKTDIEEFTLTATNTDTGDQIVIPAESTGVTGSYAAEVTFPLDLSLVLVNEFRRRGLPHETALLRCGHYSTGSIPFKFIDGYVLTRFLRGRL